MANQRPLTDEQIEQFLSWSDNNDELESDLSEIGSETEVDQDEFVGNTTTSDEATDVDENEIPLNILRSKSNINACDKIILQGKDGHKWSYVKGTTHHYKLNTIHKSRGPTRKCKNILDPLECFKLFIKGDNVDEIVKWTNVEINHRQSVLLFIQDLSKTT